MFGSCNHVFTRPFTHTAVAMNARAVELISFLGLSPHAEGGYFREIYRSASSVDPMDGRAQRAALTTIYFLLMWGDVSHWHRLASDEAWHFLEGHPLQLHEADSTFDRVVTTKLGPHDELTEPAHVVVAGSWQAARSLGEYTLVGCTVGPGFDYKDFEMLHDLPSEAESLRLEHPLLAAFI
jgi:uncharacterized protein